MFRGTKFAASVVFPAAVVLIVTMGGCARSDNPIAASGSGVPVNLAMAFSKSAAGVPLLKGVADSIRIDSVVVVVEKIRFRSRVDTVSLDTTGGDDQGEGEDGASVTFRGPFVIRVRDTLAVDFASQVLPAGTYDGITFRIHRLLPGERHEDSDERMHHGLVPRDSSVVGSSVVVWGAVKKNGVWTAFTLNADLELEFRIKGNFVVQEATGTVRIALNFNLGLWFRDPMTGAFLDPTDPSGDTRELIKKAIRFAFGQGHGGHDRDDDGHPDDERYSP
jgi:hypothetical protein